METKITEHYFQYETNKYFRGNAHDVKLGSFGQKKDPLGAKAYLAVEDSIKPEHLEGRVKRGRTTKVDWNQTTRADVGIGAVLNFFRVGSKVAADAAYEKAKSAKLELVSLAIDETPLKEILNGEADGARNSLAKEGDDGRVVSGVWVLMDGELAEHFSSSGSIKASADAGGKSLNVTASGGKEGSQTITFGGGQNAVFAYKLHKVKKWDKGKIVDMEDDFKSFG
jgi:hypothetical protein